MYKDYTVSFKILVIHTNFGNVSFNKILNDINSDVTNLELTTIKGDV